MIQLTTLLSSITSDIVLEVHTKMIQLTTSTKFSKQRASWKSMKTASPKPDRPYEDPALVGSPYMKNTICNSERCHSLARLVGNPYKTDTAYNSVTITRNVRLLEVHTKLIRLTTSCVFISPVQRSEIHTEMTALLLTSSQFQAAQAAPPPEAASIPIERGPGRRRVTRNESKPTNQDAL